MHCTAIAIAGRVTHTAAVRRSCCIAAVVALEYLAPGTSAFAQAGRRIVVVSAGTCPARAAVVSALAQAMPGVTIVADPAEDSGDAESVVVVSDAGTSYRAVVRGVVRTLFDPPARCEERARKVAIVAALALEPPLSAAPQPAPQAAVETVATEATTQHASGLWLESGGVVERGETDDSSLWPTAGTVRLTIDRDGLGAMIGGTLGSWDLAGGGRLVQRSSIDVAVQLRHRDGWIAWALELGPRLVIQRAHDADGEIYRTVHLEADIGLSGRFELWFPGHDYGVFAAVAGTYVPDPAPAGRDSQPMALGSPMPTWWLGGSAGLMFKIR
jgi:hypothetical protein